MQEILQSEAPHSIFNFRIGLRLGVRDRRIAGMTQPHTLAGLVEHKQKDAAGWTLLQKIIEEAKLTPEQEDDIYMSLGFVPIHQVAARRSIFDRLETGQPSVKVSS